MGKEFPGHPAVGILHSSAVGVGSTLVGKLVFPLQYIYIMIIPPVLLYINY